MNASRHGVGGSDYGNYGTGEIVRLFTGVGRRGASDREQKGHRPDDACDYDEDIGQHNWPQSGDKLTLLRRWEEESAPMLRAGSL